MNPSKQPTVTSVGGRTFACSPAAVLAYLIDEQERFLMLRHPNRSGWEVINGALEAGETVLDGLLREVSEEGGPKVQARPLGAFHVQNFHYDRNVRFMLSLNYLLAYEGGAVEPGDDMVGSEVAWFTVEELMDDSLEILVPPQMRWIFPRARDLYRLWIGDDISLQPELPDKAVNKYMTQKRK